TIAVAVAFTPLGNMVSENWFGLGSQAQMGACRAVGLLILSAPFLIGRANAFALLMLARRTIIITLSTLVRLLSLTVSLVVLPMWLHGRDDREHVASAQAGLVRGGVNVNQRLGNHTG